MPELSVHNKIDEMVKDVVACEGELESSWKARRNGQLEAKVNRGRIKYSRDQRRYMLYLEYYFPPKGGRFGAWVLEGVMLRSLLTC